MADNTIQTGADTIATDDLGGGVKVQRAKVGFGVDGSFADVSASSPLPTAESAANTTTGPTAFTATQATQNTPVAGGTVQLAVPNGYAGFVIDLTGTPAGGSTYSFDASVDGGTTWRALIVNGRGNALPQPFSTMTGNSYLFGVNQVEGAAYGYTHVRMRCTAFTGGDTLAVKVIATPQSGAVLPSVYTTSVGSAGVGSVPVGAPVLGGGFDGTNVQYVNVRAKGTQGALGVTTQDMKDTGRVARILRMDIPAITTATDALKSLTEYKEGTGAVTATTTPAVVTTGKRLRVQTIMLTYVGVAAAGSAKFTLRANESGLVAIGSPAVVSHVIGAPAAVAGVSNVESIPITDGLEFDAGTGIGVSVVGLNATQAAAITGYAKCAIYCFEY